MSYIKYTYTNLVEASNSDSPIEVIGTGIEVSVNNLKVGKFYLAPLYFWAQKDRSIKVEIINPSRKDKVVLSKEFVVGRSLDENGNDKWTCKKYKLDKSRHKGSCIIRIGWSEDNSTDSFKVVASPLTSKALLKEQRISAGMCPTCGKEGQWAVMAMKCLEHGVFLG